MQTRQQLVPKLTRAAEIIEKYTHKREEYILSLSPRANEDLTTDSARFLAYIEGKEVYNQRKQDGLLPIYCRILDNLTLKDQPLRADVSDDQVYKFLTQLSDTIEDIVYHQYLTLRKEQALEKVNLISSSSSERSSQELDSEQQYEQYVVKQGMEEDLSVVLGNKKGFVEDLMRIIKYSGIDRTVSLSDWHEDCRLNEVRYDWLTELATYSGEDRTQRIEAWVESMPSYAWDHFYWECD